MLLTPGHAFAAGNRETAPRTSPATASRMSASNTEPVGKVAVVLRGRTVTRRRKLPRDFQFAPFFSINICLELSGARAGRISAGGMH